MHQITFQTIKYQSKNFHKDIQISKFKKNSSLDERNFLTTWRYLRMFINYEKKNHYPTNI